MLFKRAMSNTRATNTLSLVVLTNAIFCLLVRAQTSESFLNAGAWITVKLTSQSSEGSTATSCACPAGCTNCAFKDQSMFGGDNTVKTLLTTDKPPQFVFDSSLGYASLKAYTNSSSTAAETTINACPDTSLMVCFACNNKQGYYATGYSGAYSQEGIGTVGTGVACIYQYACADGGNCEETLSGIEAAKYVGALVVVFWFAFFIFLVLRGRPWLKSVVDPCAHLDRTNPDYAIFNELAPPPTGMLGLAWLWHAIRMDMPYLRSHMTLDEYMVLRWFRMCSIFFLFASVFCTPVLVYFYFTDGEDELSGQEAVIDAALSGNVRQLSMASAKEHLTWQLCVAEMLLLSVVLVKLIERECVMFARLMWNLKPEEVGIKSHAVVITDIPRYTTSPFPSTDLSEAQTKRIAAMQDKLGKELKHEEESTSIAGRIKGLVNIAAIQKKMGDDFDHGEKKQKGILAGFQKSISKSPGSDGDLEQAGASESAADKVFAQDGRVRALMRWESDSILTSKVERIVGADKIAFKMLASDTRKLDSVARKWKAVQDYMIQYTKAHNELTKRKEEDPKAFEGYSRSARILRFELKQATRGYAKYVAKEEKFFKRFNAVREKEINSIEPAAGAVVVFKYQKDALVMGSVQIDDQFGQWMTMQAPGPTDMVWHNIASTKPVRDWKTAQVRFICVFITIFFMFPVSYATKLFNEYKSEIVKYVGEEYGETLYSIMIAVLLSILISIAGSIASVTSRLTGLTSYSLMDSFGASTYFYIVIVNLVVGNMSERELWLDLQDWLQQPHLFAYTFTRQMIATSTYFIKFIIMRTATSTIMELLNIGSIGGYCVKSVMYRVRSLQWPPQKKKVEWAIPKPTPMMLVPPQAMMIFFIAMIYSIIAPIILPFAFVFFYIMYIFGKHMYTYAYLQKYMGDIAMWAWLVRQMIFTLLFAQIVLILGMPTLGYGSEEYRIWLCPIPIITILQTMRSKELLQIALKRPMYTDNVDETEDDIKKARAGVIRAQQVKEAHEGDLGLHKHKSVEELLETGAWQGYMPSNLWPLASERAAASVVLKRWRQYKAKKAAAPSVGGGGLFSKAPAAKVEEKIVPLKKVAPDATPLPPMSEPKKDLQKVKTLTQEQIDAQNAREAAAEAEIKRIEDAKAPKDVKIEVAAAQAPAAVDAKETTSTAAGTPTKKKEEEPAKQKNVN
jgi:hypothetical protein